MSETSKLVLALVFFFVIGIFLTFFQTDTFSRVIGSWALAMACLGVLAVWLKRQGKTLADLSARPKVQQTSGEVLGTNTISFAKKPTAQLSKKSLNQLDRAVSVLRSFGIFSPECPKSELFVEALADYGEPVTLDALFVALDEASYYHRDFEISRYDANFTFLPSKTEQLQQTIEAQVQAILALCKDEIVFSSPLVAAAGNHRVQINVDINGERFECAYLANAKYLSTAPFVGLAKHLAKMDKPIRLACFWTDQGAYVTRIANETLGALNKALGKSLTVNGKFSWLDEEEGFEAGSISTSSKH